MITSLSGNETVVKPGRGNHPNCRKHQFKKGNSGNPGGGLHARKTALGEIAKAIDEFQKEHGVPYWKAATILAMKLAQGGNTTLLCKVMDKFVPSKIEESEDDIPIKLPIVRLYGSGPETRQ